MDRTAGTTATTASGANDGMAAVRRSNDVWVLPAARIKEILRGTFLENPAVPPAMR